MTTVLKTVKLHCTLNTVHCIEIPLYRVHCELYRVYSTLHHVFISIVAMHSFRLKLCIVKHIMHCRECNVHCTECIIHSTVSTVQCPPGVHAPISPNSCWVETMHSVLGIQCTVNSVQCTVSSTQWTVSSIQWTVSSIQCSVQCVGWRAASNRDNSFPDTWWRGGNWAKYGTVFHSSAI